MSTIEVIEEPMQGLKVIDVPRYGDSRGFFQEVHHSDRYQALGICLPFVQDNWSRSARGTVRGLHYQLKFPQGKLLQVITGAIYDAVVDIRKGSSTFGQSFGIELNEQSGTQLFVPAGFAHGFCVLSETANILYKCTDVYHPEDDNGIRWDDPALSIAWPTEAKSPILSDKDSVLPYLADVPPEALPE